MGEVLRKLSFVIPCYRSEQTIARVVQEVISTVKTRKGYSYEIILVSDHSS
jgi:undecaprenyl-phosphate 4-deoxy-4-formamido-L-arabinose transferase